MDRPRAAHHALGLEQQRPRRARTDALRLHRQLAQRIEGRRSRARLHPARQRNHLRNALAHRPLLPQRQQLQRRHLCQLRPLSESRHPRLSRDLSRGKNRHSGRVEHVAERGQLLQDTLHPYRRLRRHRTVLLPPFPRLSGHARRHHPKSGDDLSREVHPDCRGGLFPQMVSRKCRLQHHADLARHRRRTAQVHCRPHRNAQPPQERRWLLLVVARGQRIRPRLGHEARHRQLVQRLAVGQRNGARPACARRAPTLPEQRVRRHLVACERRFRCPKPLYLRPHRSQNRPSTIVEGRLYS